METFSTETLPRWSTESLHMRRGSPAKRPPLVVKFKHQWANEKLYFSILRSLAIRWKVLAASTQNEMAARQRGPPVLRSPGLI
jgi:hypothetical protein